MKRRHSSSNSSIEVVHETTANIGDRTLLIRNFTEAEALKRFGVQELLFNGSPMPLYGSEEMESNSLKMLGQILMHNI